MIKRKKITINKKAKDWKIRYPLVEIEWIDICSDASWMSFGQLSKMSLPSCFTKGHLYSQAKGITRVFGDISTGEDNEIETVGNVTILPNSVIKNIKKL